MSANACSSSGLVAHRNSPLVEAATRATGGAVSAYDDAAAYPYDYVPTSYGSPPPPQRAGRDAQLFTAVGVPAALPPGTFIVPPQPPCSS